MPDVQAVSPSLSETASGLCEYKGCSICYQFDWFAYYPLNGHRPHFLTSECWCVAFRHRHGGYSKDNNLCAMTREWGVTLEDTQH